ncbi:MAG: phosphodiester glycosidase family protein [Anaerolineaceae bacterium]|nr:MAG: phosphodiester glycosidase family protein [Anaerolineaceae bacterium]
MTGMKPRLRKSTILIGLLLLIGLCIASSFLYLHGRPVPVPVKQTLRDGVEYQRIIHVSPRPMVIHVLKINMKTRGLKVVITPPDNPKSDKPLNARTTSQFLKEFDLDIAINGDGFSPWWSRGPADYYPHVGDPVTPRGEAASRGTVYGREPEEPFPTIYISQKNTLSFDAPNRTYDAISGEARIVMGGSAVEGFTNTEVHPRTAVGYSKNGKFLYLVVVDGRQPFYSQGVTLAELADLMIQIGAHDAMSLDGGGSSTMVIRGGDGNPRILNSPIDQYIPGRERPVANHFGIHFKK